MAKIVDDVYTPVWKDRRRILGMPITFTKYEVTADRLINRKGLFRTETDEMLLYRIIDIKMSQTLGQKMFGVGTITLYCADKSDSVFELKNVKKPDAVRRFLSKAVEHERTTKGIVGREIYGIAGASASASPYGFVDVDGDGIPD